MILSHKHKFIFISNGKTGSTSIENALSKYQEGEYLNLAIPDLFTKGHIPAVLLKQLVKKEIWNNYFKFSFVRNPWDWVVSQYFYNFHEKPQKDQTKKSKHSNSPSTEDKTCLTTDDIYKLYNFLKQYRGIPDAETLLQHNYIYNSNGVKQLDYVGKFESLNADFQGAMDKIGIHAILPVLNNSKHDYYKHYYNHETIELVKILYEIDIKSFDYEY